jgi:predicted DNA-binding protein (MmcQ/YjbR family)
VTRNDVLELCTGMPGAVEEYPFGEGAAVFKISDKMFALVALDGEPGSVSLKCDPTTALELRARYPAVRAGYHLNKRHWNSIELDGSVDPEELRWMIRHSYELVFSGLTAAKRAAIASRAADPDQLSSEPKASEPARLRPQGDDR